MSSTRLLKLLSLGILTSCAQATRILQSEGSRRVAAGPPSLAEALAARGKLRKTVRPVKVVQTSEALANKYVAPNTIADAVFVNYPRETDSLAKVFETSGCKLLLVDFFAFACTNCIRAGATLKNIYAEFKPHGLEILAFARPEFGFEGDPAEVKAWVEREEVPYPVATDAKDTNWNTWGVTMWPTHFLVIEKLNNPGQFVKVFDHVGDQNSHKLYNEIKKRLAPSMPDYEPMNSVGHTDVEVFFGDSFRKKNKDGKSCDKGCGLESPNEVNLKHPRLPELPLPTADGTPTADGGADKVLIYGASWCRFCRQTKYMLEHSSVEYEYVDVAEYGGHATVLAFLVKQDLMPEEHKTLPIVFQGQSFVGGFDDIIKREPFSSNFDKSSIEANTPLAPVPSVIEYSKHNSMVWVSPSSDGWTVNKESLIALKSGASLEFQAELANTRTTSLYVVCQPPTGTTATITTSTGEEISINWPGRHFITSYDGDQPSDILYFSAGTRVMVFWLSAEDPKRVRDVQIENSNSAGGS